MTTNPCSAVVRPATSKDREAILGVFERLRQGSIRPELSDRELDRMVACGQHHHAAVATVDDAVVGYGRWVRTNPSTPRADMAVAVDEAFEHRGIGTALLTHLRREARRRGIEHLEIRMARTPEMVRELARRPSVTKSRFEDSDIVVRLKTRDALPGQEHDAMKWAARGETHLVGAVVGNVRPEPDEPAR